MCGRRCSAWYSLPVAASASNCLAEPRAFPSTMIALTLLGRSPGRFVTNAGGLSKEPRDLTWKHSSAPRVQTRRVAQLCLRPSKKLGGLRRRAGAGDFTLKFENIDPLGTLFAKWLAEVVAASGSAFQADVVLPVPLHRQRERERGYNQAALIAKPLAKLLGLPYKSGYSPESGRVPTSIC
jgi:hypothetical protein